jgi:GNAT superfamily N-acetyltransferase
MIDPSEYVGLARETGVYEDIELDMLKDALAAWERGPGDPNGLVELRDGKVLAGFILVCRDESANHSFDARAFCVDPSYAGKGIADRLLETLEERTLERESSAILRFETSARKEAAFGEGALARAGYALIGHIPDFYGRGNDYLMYAKHLRLRAVEGEGRGTGGGERGRP